MEKPKPPEYVVHDCYDDLSFIADDMADLKEWVEAAIESGTDVDNLKVFRIGVQLEVRKELIIQAMD